MCIYHLDYGSTEYGYNFSKQTLKEVHNRKSLKETMLYSCVGDVAIYLIRKLPLLPGYNVLSN